MTKVPPQDHAAVSTGCWSATEGEEKKFPLWRPDDDFSSQMLLDITSYNNAMFYLAPEMMMVNVSRTTCSPPSTPALGERMLGGRDGLLAESRRHF